MIYDTTEFTFDSAAFGLVPAVLPVKLKWSRKTEPVFY
jgi:hypothetical protein